MVRVGILVAWGGVGSHSQAAEARGAFCWSVGRSEAVGSVATGQERCLVELHHIACELNDCREAVLSELEIEYKDANI